MAQIGRPGLSAAEEKSEVWRRWRSGEALNGIGRAIDKHPASVFGILKLQGGITPVARHRSSRSLSLREREEISRGIAAGYSMRSITEQLGRSASTVCREINRHGGVTNARVFPTHIF